MSAAAPGSAPPPAAGAAEMKWLILQRLQELENRPPQVDYQRDFKAFLQERVWTKDEAAGGLVARVPDWPFLADLCDDMLTEPRLFVEKSRRVLATWTAMALDLWLAAGGQDPRWPVLMNARGNRQIFMVFRKYEDGVKHLRERTRFMLQHLMHPPEGPPITEFWPDFPKAWTFKEDEMRAENGSLITVLGQGQDQARSHGATLLHLEEVAFWEMAQQTIEGAIPTLRGGGHIVCVSTAQANSFAARIVSGQIRARRG